MTNRKLESYEPIVKYEGLKTSKNVVLNGTTTFNAATTINGAVQLNNVFIQGGITQGTAQALATTTPLSVTPTSSLLTLTPTQNQTLNFSAPAQPGLYMNIEIVTSGTSSFTITFGTNFKSQGTLATGVVSGKTFMVATISDSTQWIELSRTAAM